MPDLTPVPGDYETEPLAAPDGLGEAGSAYWLRVVEEFDLGAVEEPALLEACRTLDAIEDLETALGAHGRVTVDGKPSPLLVEIRQQRASLVRLLGLLDLPGEGEEGRRSTLSASRAASAAASERWRKARSKGRFHG